MKPILRVSLCVLAAGLLPFAVGLGPFVEAHSQLMSPPPQTGVPLPPPPVLDPQKPTVVVVLGQDVSEVADVLVPYQIFALSKQFNVVTAAPERRPVALTGGLDLLPHFSFSELDRQPDAFLAGVVVPNIPFIREPQNAPVLTWLKEKGKHSQTLLLSICTGAETLALTGLLDGKQATAHWGDLPGLQKKFPRVRWVTGVRYVDAGQQVSSAGVLSGVEASLYVLERLAGTEVMQGVARQLRYPVSALQHPQMPPVNLAPQDSIFLLNAFYLWDRPTYQLPLKKGIDEMDLAALFDTFPATFSARLVTTAATAGPVRSRFGLDLLPRQTRSSFPLLKLTGQGFPFDEALTALARLQNVPTARFAAKRLEYRSLPRDLQGANWGVPVVYRGVGLGVLGVLLVLLLEWGFLKLKHRGPVKKLRH